MGSYNKPQLAVVMVPFPAQGHLNQLLHLSRRLASAASIHYISTATHIRQAKLRAHDPSPGAITFHELPTPSFENPPPDPNSTAKFPIHILPSLSTVATNLRFPVRGLVENLSKTHERVVVIYDSLMAYAVQDIDAIPNAKSYKFWSVSAITLYFLRWHARGRPQLPGLAGSVLNQIPGPEGLFPPITPEFKNPSRKNVCGLIYNSNRALEGVFLDLLAEAKAGGVTKHWALGPFNPTKINHHSNALIRHPCLDWLDKQEPDSVMLVLFGTTTSFPDEQIKEVANGLEESGHKFLWALRDADRGDIFRGEIREPVLPDGFEERVKGRGVVTRSWVPQLEILGHRSTGGFMSHCGWNSCVESLSMGVPVAAWPVHSDQPVNAVLLTRMLGVGVEVRDWAHGPQVVRARQVARAVMRLMGSREGKEMRERAKELGVRLRGSVGDLDSFMNHITLHSSL